MKGFWPALFVLCLLCGFFFFWGLTANDLYKTEGNRALPAREMLARGSWLVPYMYGRPYLAKPPGIYVCIMLASKALGGEVTALSARLPSALAAAFSVLVVFLALARHLGPRVGLAGGLMLCMSLPWLDKSGSADIEMLLIALVTASLFAAQFALSCRRGEAPAWVVAYLFVGLGFLTKGPPSLIFFYSAMIPFVIWRKRARVLVRWPHLLGLLVGALIIAAWIGLAIREVGWDALRQTSSSQTEARFVMKWGKYPVDALLHPLKIAATLLPWSVFAVFAFFRRGREGHTPAQRDFVDFLRAFIVASLIFWSLLPVHPARYSYPILPAVAALAATAWSLWFDGRPAIGRLMRLANGLGLCLAAGGIVFGTVRIIGMIDRHVAATTVFCVLGLAGSAFGLGALALRRPRLVFAGWLVVWIALKIFFVEVYLPERKLRKSTAPAGRAVGRCAPPGQVLYGFRNWHQPMLFYAHREIHQLDDPSELPAGPGPFYLLLTPAQEVRWRTGQGFRISPIRSFFDQEGREMILATARRLP